MVVTDLRLVTFHGEQLTWIPVKVGCRTDSDPTYGRNCTAGAAEGRPSKYWDVFPVILVQRLIKAHPELISLHDKQHACRNPFKFIIQSVSAIYEVN
jgi:hypothetical protein